MDASTLNREAPSALQAALYSVLIWVPGFLLVYGLVDSWLWRLLFSTAWALVLFLTYYRWARRVVSALDLYTVEVAERTHLDAAAARGLIWGGKGIGWVAMGVTHALLVFALGLPALSIVLAVNFNQSATMVRTWAEDEAASRPDLVEMGVPASTLTLYDESIDDHLTEARGWDRMAAFQLAVAVALLLVWGLFAFRVARKSSEALLIWCAARAKPGDQQELIGRAVQLSIEHGRLPGVA